MQRRALNRAAGDGDTRKDAESIRWRLERDCIDQIKSLQVRGGDVLRFWVCRFLYLHGDVCAQADASLLTAFVFAFSQLIKKTTKRCPGCSADIERSEVSVL